MAISDHIVDREQDKFIAVGPSGLTAVNVATAGSAFNVNLNDPTTSNDMFITSSNELIVKDVQGREIQFRMLQMLEKIERHLSAMTGEDYFDGDLANRKK